MFWIASALAVVVGAIVLAALLMLLGPPRTDGGRLWTAALTMLGVGIGFMVLSIGLATGRGVEDGIAQADSARADRYEAHGRRAGRAVGEGLARVTGRSRTHAASASQDDTRMPAAEAPRPSLDDAARSVGMMVGRRLRDRRNRS